MPLDLKTDGHVHCKLCHHAVGEMEEYVLAACERGLERLVFLEHFEAGINYFETTWLTRADFDVYFATGRQLQERYRGRIDIGLGVEVGYNPERVAETVSFINEYQWDRIGLSYHFLGQGERHLNMLTRKPEKIAEFNTIGVAEALRLYLEGLRQAVSEIPATVLCHLDAALRHHPELEFSPSHQQQMLALVDALAYRGMALEINTSGFDHRRQQPYPPSWLIKRAGAQGVELVLGSDAHRPQDVGRYFERVPLWLAE